mgnify:CR=1 FL=1
MFASLVSKIQKGLFFLIGILVVAITSCVLFPQQAARACFSILRTTLGVEANCGEIVYKNGSFYVSNAFIDSFYIEEASFSPLHVFSPPNIVFICKKAHVELSSSFSYSLTTALLLDLLPFSSKVDNLTIKGFEDVVVYSQNRQEQNKPSFLVTKEGKQVLQCIGDITASELSLSFTILDKDLLSFVDNLSFLEGEGTLSLDLATKEWRGKTSFILPDTKLEVEVSARADSFSNGEIEVSRLACIYKNHFLETAGKIVYNSSKNMHVDLGETRCFTPLVGPFFLPFLKADITFDKDILFLHNCSTALHLAEFPSLSLSLSSLSFYNVPFHFAAAEGTIEIDAYSLPFFCKKEEDGAIEGQGNLYTNGEWTSCIHLCKQKEHWKLSSGAEFCLELYKEQEAPLLALQMQKKETELFVKAVLEGKGIFHIEECSLTTEHFSLYNQNRIESSLDLEGLSVEKGLWNIEWKGEKKAQIETEKWSISFNEHPIIYGKIDIPSLSIHRLEGSLRYIDSTWNLEIEGSRENAPKFSIENISFFIEDSSFFHAKAFVKFLHKSVELDAAQRGDVLTVSFYTEEKQTLQLLYNLEEETIFLKGNLWDFYIQCQGNLEKIEGKIRCKKIPEHFCSFTPLLRHLKNIEWLGNIELVDFSNAEMKGEWKGQIDWNKHIVDIRGFVHSHAIQKKIFLEKIRMQSPFLKGRIPKIEIGNKSATVPLLFVSFIDLSWFASGLQGCYIEPLLIKNLEVSHRKQLFLEGLWQASFYCKNRKMPSLLKEWGVQIEPQLPRKAYMEGTLTKERIFLRKFQQHLQEEDRFLYRLNSEKESFVDFQGRCNLHWIIEQNTPFQWFNSLKIAIQGSYPSLSYRVE